ncbi:MAG TPA: hypothetical protein VFX59_15120 [Polyangiales bacterium]|nr:hypothetical protein [Polyangiales bacterium]
MRMTRTLVLSALWLVSCGSDESTKQGARSPSANGCEEEGEGCDCDDERGGAYACEAGELVCECASSGEVAPPRDAGKRDAGKRDAAVDAAKPAADAAKDDPKPSDAGAVEPPSTSGADPKIPAKPATCPEIKTGNITVNGQQVQLWVGAKKAGKKGPIMFYWHGTGSNSREATGGLAKGNQEILDEGGVIASFTTTTSKGQNTGNNVWYTGDFEMADQILACAIEQQDVDPRRVYTAGCSAGGLQASAMVYARSSYLAGAMPNSGGTVFPYKLEDANHIPKVIATHGAAGVDVVVIDFASTTATMSKDIVAKGGFMVVCDHGGRHCASPTPVKNAQWDFLKAHPFGVEPEPYAAGLPADFPTSCKIIAK